MVLIAKDVETYRDLDKEQVRKRAKESQRARTQNANVCLVYSSFVVECMRAPLVTRTCRYLTHTHSVDVALERSHTTLIVKVASMFSI